MTKTDSATETLNVWQLVALNDAHLERIDLLLLNLAVVREIPGSENLDIARYVSILDEWTAAFGRKLPKYETQFYARPSYWRNDLNFFHIGMLMGFLGREIGIRYIPELKDTDAVYYTNPGQLFLHGLLDTKEGTCGNMAALHVAICRRFCWPVSLACVKSHYISRYDDGKVYHNIEATSAHSGQFCADPDEFYIKKFDLPPRAVACGSDLRKLTAREMIGAFLALQGRYYRDVGDMERADISFSFGRILFPTYRKVYINAMIPMIKRGEKLFERDELGHPNSLFRCFAPTTLIPEVYRELSGGMDIQFLSPPRTKPQQDTRTVFVPIASIQKLPERISP